MAVIATIARAWGNVLPWESCSTTLADAPSRKSTSSGWMVQAVRGSK